MFAKAAFALFLAAAPAFAADCARSYTIQEGDICDSISAANQVSTYQLAAINPQIDAQCENLMPGQSLCLGYGGAEDCTTTQVVKADDSCEGIASSAGLNSTILMLNNPQLDDACSNLYIGQVLCVAQTVQVPVASGSVPTAIPTTAVAVSSTVLSAAPTSSTVSSAAAATSSAADDEDDDDLPFCDEL